MKIKVRKTDSKLVFGYQCFSCCRWTKADFPIPGFLGWIFKRIPDGDSAEIELPGAVFCDSCAKVTVPGYVTPEAYTLPDLERHLTDEKTTPEDSPA